MTGPSDPPAGEASPGPGAAAGGSPASGSEWGFGGADTETLTPDAAKAEIGRVEQAAYDNPQHPWIDANHPGHADAVKRVSGLHKIAGGGSRPLGGDWGMPAPDAGTLTAEAAQAEIERVTRAARDNPQHPYIDANHPGHAAAVKRVSGLHKIAAGGERNSATRAAEEARISLGVEPISDPTGFGPALADAQIGAADKIADFQSTVEALGGWMAELRLTDSEARNIVRAFNGRLDSGAASDQEAERRASGQATLRSLWHDKFADNLEIADRALDRVKADDKFYEFLTLTGLRYDPWMIEALRAAAVRNNW